MKVRERERGERGIGVLLKCYKYYIVECFCCQIYGEDLVFCFFIRNWFIREFGVRYLSKEVVGVLIKGMGEGKSGVMFFLEKVSYIY